MADVIDGAPFQATATAHHCIKTAEHSVLTEYVEDARYVLGMIDLDPASSAQANRVVRAKRYCTPADNGLHQPWGGRVFVKPPDDDRSELVSALWHRANEHALYGGSGAVVLWLGLSLEKFRILQSCRDLALGVPCPGPMDWPHVIASRVKGARGDRMSHVQHDDTSFDRNTGAGKPDEQACLTCGTYSSLLGGHNLQRKRFRERFGQYGHHQPGRRFKRPRHIANELLAAVKQHGALTKGALIRAVRIRTKTGLTAINGLIASGRLVVRNRKIELPGPRGNTREGNLS